MDRLYCDRISTGDGGTERVNGLVYQLASHCLL